MPPSPHSLKSTRSATKLGTELTGQEVAGVDRLPRFRAYGEPDDHLRLSVLLADRLPGDREAAQACKQPRLSWPERRRRLEEFLGTVRPKGSGYMAVFVDPDALHPGQLRLEHAWDDFECLQERMDLFRLLLESAQRQGGWLFLRPAPSPERTSDMAHFPLLEAAPAWEVRERELPELSAARAALAPALQPLLDWLLQKKTLEPRYAAVLLHEAPRGDPSAGILGLAYDQLRPSAQETAKRLSLLRREQPLNGHLGAYALGSKAGPHTFRQSDVEELLHAGFLQRERARGRVVMPTKVRRFLYAHAEVGMEREVEEEHRWLGRQQVARVDVEALAELHHHAVLGGELERALETATFYGSDLRERGVWLSFHKRYREAASIFQVVVEQFDSQDAYAWEYLGFNLAQAHKRPTEEVQQRVLGAYRRAFELAPNNPLYHGRWLGYRARFGEQVQTEVEQALRKYRSAYGTVALGWFGEQVLRGLRAGGQAAFAEQLVSQWPGLKRGHRGA